jgi:hypothetical protein
MTDTSHDPHPEGTSSDAESGKAASPEQKPTKSPKVVTAFYTDVLLGEQVYDQQSAQASFELYDATTGERTRLPEVVESGSCTRIVPLSDDLVHKGLLRLPERSEPFGSVAELLADIERHLRRCLVFGNPSDLVLAKGFTIYTWLHDRFSDAAYMRFMGDKGTGKSRMLQVIGDLCYKPLLVQGNISSASLFRAIDGCGHARRRRVGL